jgi:hydroxymethyl cephem carbamoyltransferase
MLSFHRCISSALPAVTHVDGSARLQTVTRSDQPSLYELLKTYHCLGGVPVLCNTSLNFPGLGFINRMSDLLHFARERRLEGFVVNDQMFLSV